jgi:hypothetical protein
MRREAPSEMIKEETREIRALLEGRNSQLGMTG